MVTRRSLLGGTLSTALLPAAAREKSTDRPCTIILAPSNLGLRPNPDGSLPGTWRAPEALLDAGLARQFDTESIVRLPRPYYQSGAEEGSHIRNGSAIRRFAVELGKTVAKALKDRSFPIVVGGDCSILLGCLLGARAAGSVGLIHVDGHSDFYHPGNYDTSSRLGSAAGMDLALATGRGEPLLALWDGRPLVEDGDVVQIGERDELEIDYDYRDIETTSIRRFPIRKVQQEGVAETVIQALAGMPVKDRPIWLHVDLDVLDQKVMPAVDSPGSPGLDFDELASLLAKLIGSRRIIGLNVSIFDPELDPNGRYARQIVDCLTKGLAPLSKVRGMAE